MTIDELITSFSTKDEFIIAVERELRTLAINNPYFKYVHPDHVGNINPSYLGPAITKKTKMLAGPQCKGCIFGQALVKMGVSPSELNHRLDIKSIIPCCPESWLHLQKSQDKGVGWRKCVNNLYRRM